MPTDKSTVNNNDALRKRAEKTVRRHMYGAFGMGLIPIPIVDLTALVGVQLNLVRKLTAIYDVPFSKNAGKNIVSSILAGALPTLSGPYLASLVKVIPIVGMPLGMVSAPFVAAAATYAMGQIFMGHFESGGTLLTIDKDKAKVLFANLFAGRNIEEADEIVHETDHQEPEVAQAAEATVAQDETDENSRGNEAPKKSTKKKQSKTKESSRN